MSLLVQLFQADCTAGFCTAPNRTLTIWTSVSECKTLTYTSVCLSCYASHGTWARMQDTNTDLWPVHLSIIILSTHAQDLASLESAHQIGLTVFLHERWMRFGSHSSSLQRRRGVWEQDQIWFVYIHVHACTYVHWEWSLTRQDLYYVQSSSASGCPDIPENLLMRQWITQGNQLYFALKKAVKRHHMRYNQSWQDP